jgi:putative addiction module component (TIGR02574 family)
MTSPLSNLLQDALRLSATDRGELAARLLESLDPDTEADADEAWAKEIATRLDDYRSGRVKPIPGQEALRLIFSEDDGD